MEKSQNKLEKSEKEKQKNIIYLDEDKDGFNEVFIE